MPDPAPRKGRVNTAGQELTYSQLAEFVDKSVDGIIVTDSSHVVVWCNKAAEAQFERGRDQFIGIEFGFPVMPGESTEITLFRKSGAHRVVELRAAEIGLSGGTGLLISLRDITDRKTMEREIRQKEKEKTYLLDNIADAVLTISDNLGIESANKAAVTIFGWTEPQLKGRPVLDLFRDTEHAELKAWLDAARQEEGFRHGGASRLFNGRRADGWDISIEMTLARIQVNDGKGFILAARDITGKIQSEQQLRIASSAIEQSLLASVIIRDDDVIDYVNPKFSQLTGYAGEEAIGRSGRELFDKMAQDAEDYDARLRQARNEAGYYETVSLKGKNGENYWVGQYVSAIRSEAGDITHYLVSLEDITQKINLARELEHKSNYDELTGLLNRNGMFRHLQGLVEERAGELDSYHLFLVDIDKFGVIIHGAGKVVADRLLADVADVLFNAAPVDSLVARIEADTYLIAARMDAPEAAVEFAAGIIGRIREMKLVAGDRYFNPTATLTFICMDQLDPGNNIDVLVQRCVIGASFAKDSGGDQVYKLDLHDKKLLSYDLDAQGISLVNKAIANDLFCLYSQPIQKINGASDTYSYELLIRMRDGDKIVPPAHFISAAEKYKMGTRIDEWVINRIFSWLADNPDHIARLGHCGINVSAESLAGNTLTNYIRGKLEQYRIPPEKICFEITETAAVKSLELANGNLKALKALGCKIALDDFGTGMSSFNYLKKLDVDYLKIDGAFIRNITTDPIDFAMVNAIKDVGKTMKIETIAEYVENDAILSLLTLIGIDYAQGYGIGKPELLC